MINVHYYYYYIYTECTTIAGDEELSFGRQVGLDFGFISLHPLPGGAMMDQVIACCNKLHADIHSKQQDSWATSHSTTNCTHIYVYSYTYTIQQGSLATVNNFKSQPVTSYNTTNCTHILIVIHYTARQLYTMYDSHII